MWDERHQRITELNRRVDCRRRYFYSVGNEMTKREHLYRWLVNQADWLYIRQIPHERFGMTKETCSRSLCDMCEQGRAESRITGLKQYRAIPNVVSKKGPKPPKGLK